jgi:methylated-DNA-protein-cysteine methyltransferase-like protein
MTPMDFRRAVIAFIKKVPKGKVVSYGQVAAMAGSPHAARQVGGILRALDPTDGKVPWWRVVNNQGIISIKGNWTATKEVQRSFLIKEGVEVTETFSLDMEKYRLKN